MAKKQTQVEKNKQYELIEHYRENPDVAAFELLGVDLAPHQRLSIKAMWKCPFVILCLTRGGGKCEDYENLIQLDSGFIKIGDLCESNGNKLGFSSGEFSIKGENGFNNTSHTYINDPKPIYYIRTNFGFEKKAVDKHKIRCLCNGSVVWKRMDDITIGENVLINRDSSYDFKGKFNNIDNDEAYLIGAIIGNGNFTRDWVIKFSNIDNDILEQFRINHKKLGETSFLSSKEKNGFLISSVDKSKNNIILNKYKIKKEIVYNEGIPISILQSNKQSLASFISGYIDINGKITERGIRTSSFSESLLRQLQIVLLSFGIISNRKSKKIKYKNKIKNIWILSIDSENTKIFANKIGLRCKKKLKIINKIFNTSKIPSINRNYFVDIVKNINILEQKTTYDVHIPNDHTFISNGFVSHNTFLLALFSILRAMLYPSEKIGIIAPTYRQCLDLNGLTQIFTNKGMSSPKEFFDNAEISKDLIQSISKPNIIKNKWENIESDGISIETEGMFNFSAKVGHRVLSVDSNGFSYKNIENLSIGDILPVRIGFNLFGESTSLPVDRFETNIENDSIIIPKILTYDFARFLGLFVANGTLYKKGDVYEMSFVTKDKDILKDYSNLCKLIFGITVNIKEENNNCWNVSIFNKRLYEFIEKCGISNSKTIPLVIRTSPKEFVSKFLQGLFDACGYVYSNANVVGLFVQNKTLANEVRDILLNFGIFSKIKKSQKSYIIRISSFKYTQRFLENIGFKLIKKMEILKKYKHENKCKLLDKVPTPKGHLYKLKKHLVSIYGEVEGSKIIRKAFGQIKSSFITRDSLKRGMNILSKYCNKQKEFKNIEEQYLQEYEFVRINKKSNTRCETFDIEVENEACYLAGGLIHHNSKFVFGEIEKMYEESPELRAACIKPPVRSPEYCYLKFHGAENKIGSSIQALPLGDGGKIRGARFFTIICDELAQIPRDIIDIVVRGMMATSKNPMENARKIEKQKKLFKQGKIKKIEGPEQNKIIFASTAYYQYNHFWERIQGFQSILEEKIIKAKKLEKEGKPIPEELKVIRRGTSPNFGQIKHRIMMDDKRAIVFFNFNDPPEGFMNNDSIEEAKREMSDYKFKMEYLCFFPSDSDGFFKRSLLDKAREHRMFSCHLKSKGDDLIYIMGIDPARTGDNFAIAIYAIDIKKREMQLVMMFAYNKKTFPEMHNEIRMLIKLYNIQEIGMDSGGGGQTIRDLLADEGSCPMGEELILQMGFEEHRFMKGRHILELFEFSKYELVHTSNHNLLSSLQHGELKIAAPPPCGGETITPELELADEEIEQTLEEMQNIVVKSTATGKMHWDTSTKAQKKDRYSAALIGYHMASSYLLSINKPVELAGGFWN